MSEETKPKNYIPWGRTDGKPGVSKPKKPSTNEYRDCKVCNLPFIVKKQGNRETCRDCIRDGHKEIDNG